MSLERSAAIAKADGRIAAQFGHMMIRNPSRTPHVQQRPSEGMPVGGWAAADLNLPAYWYQALATSATGCEYPISGDQQPEKREGA